jgi:tetratricopeptide (TPR) repeat protein
VRKTQRLAEVTTSSLEALRLYSRSLSLPTSEAVPLLEEAVRIDSTFAMAHRRLSGRYIGQSRYQLAVEAAAAAYRHRDRLTERGRLMTVGTYHYARGEYEPAVTAYRTIVDKWPDDSWAPVNLTIAYRDLGDWVNAAKYYEIGVQLDMQRENALVNLRNVAIYQGRAAEVSSISRERRAAAVARGRPQTAIENLANEASFRIAHSLPADDLRRQLDAKRRATTPRCCGSGSTLTKCFSRACAPRVSGSHSCVAIRAEMTA